MQSSLHVLGGALGRLGPDKTAQACRLGALAASIPLATRRSEPSSCGLSTSASALAAAGEASALTSREERSGASSGPSVGSVVREASRHAADQLGLPSYFAETSPKPTPATARSWDDVPLPEDAKEPLKAAALGPHVGLALVRELGYSAALDLALISDEQIHALRPTGGQAGGPAAAATPGAMTAPGGLKPLEVARLVAVCRAAREARLSPRSGSLQELADLLRVLNRAMVVDLGGLTFSGPLKPNASSSSSAGSGSAGAQPQQLRISGNNVTLANGHLHLLPDQVVQVTGRNVVLSDLTIETTSARAAPSSAAAAAAAAASPASTSSSPDSAGSGDAAAPAAAAPPPPQRVDVGLVSVLGGTARLTRCRLVNQAPQVAVLVGGGGRAELWHSEVAGSGGAGVLAMGQSASVAIHHSRVADTAGTCVHVGGGASAVLSSSEVRRSRLFCGLVAQGPGSRLEARRVVADGSAESNVFVEQGASVLMQDCRLTRSVERQGLQARGRGSVAELQRCVLSDNGQSGAYVLSGAAVDMQGCTVHGNGISGVTAAGGGSRVRLAGCQLAGNAGAGVHVAGGAEAELDGCEVTGPPVDPTAAPSVTAGGAGSEAPQPPPPLIRAQGEGSRVALRASKCTGEVAALDGGVVDM